MIADGDAELDTNVSRHSYVLDWKYTNIQVGVTDTRGLSLIRGSLCRLLGLLGLLRLLREWEFFEVGLAGIGPHVQIIGALKSSDHGDCLAISFKVLHVI